MELRRITGPLLVVEGTQHALSLRLAKPEDGHNHPTSALARGGLEPGNLVHVVHAEVWDAAVEFLAFLELENQGVPVGGDLTEAANAFLTVAQGKVVNDG